MWFVFFSHACVSVLYTVSNLLIIDASVALRVLWLVLLLYRASLHLFGYQLAIYKYLQFGTNFMEFTSTMYVLHFAGILTKFVIIFWKDDVNLKNVSSQR